MMNEWMDRIIEWWMNELNDERMDELSKVYSMDELSNDREKERWMMHEWMNWV